MVGEKVKLIFVFIYSIIPISFCINITISMLTEIEAKQDILCETNSNFGKFNLIANVALVIMLSFIYNTKRAIKTGVI